jgi:cytoskeletal protein CcmA (bactofilin family)
MARTLIGPGTRVAGPLSGDDDLVVEGTVDGPVTSTAQVVIAAGARVRGEVRGRDVIVGGKLEHPVHATGTIRLLATAEVRADLIAPRIAIDEGAQFEGQVKMTRPAAATAAAPPPVPAAPVGPGAGPSPPASTVTAPRDTPPVKPAAPTAKSREIPSLPSIGKVKIARRTP